MIARIFETHIHVSDLERSMRFYEDILGLELGMLDAERQVAFYWVGGRNVSMLGLWRRPVNEIVSQHFAFEVTLYGFDAAQKNLQQQGVSTYNFLQDGSSRPMVFGWMPALSCYFRDPDGHELEYIAPLTDLPCPEAGIVSLERWREIVSANQSSTGTSSSL